MENNNILEKVKKLLALANSSNENEAKLASARAQALLTKHNLAMSDVNSVDQRYVNDLFRTGKKCQSQEWKFVQAIVREFFFVEICGTKQRFSPDSLRYDPWDRNNYEECYMIFGQPHNVEIATYMIDFLTRAFKDSFKAYRKSTGAPVGHKGSYYHGLWQGLREQLLESQKSVEQETGLVVVKDKDLADFMSDALNGNVKSKSLSTNVRSGEAMAAGSEKGKNMTLSKGIGGSADKTKVGQTLALGSGE